MKKIALFLFVCVALCAPGLKADPLAFATVQNTEFNSFGTLDLTTGVYTFINSSELSGLALAAFNGTLYAAQEDGDTLYTVDPTTGNLTTVGTFTGAFDGAAVLGATSAGLYIMDEDSQLDSINPSTGAATVLGPTGAPPFANWTVLSNNGSSLYLGDESDFYSVNTTTGAATLVGGYGAPIAGQGDAQMGAMVFEGGVLYGAQEGGTWIDTIDPSTGLATGGPIVTGGPGSTSGGFVLGLAPDPLSSSTSPVPEPRSAMLLVGLLGAFGLVLRRRLSNS
jgi:MYXO-CTERM domain-containing protein